jgi:hypothetical protein
MAITRNAPNVVYLGGPRVENNTLAAKEVITPGMLVDPDSTGGVNRWKKAATAGGPGTTFATDQAMLNKGVDDVYNINDLVETSTMGQGATVWALIASGANVAFGATLQNAGNGKLVAGAGASQAFRALEAINNTAGPGDARIRVEVL